MFNVRRRKLVKLFGSVAATWRAADEDRPGHQPHDYEGSWLDDSAGATGAG
jgi:hypothetical protein